jgi:anti-sigma B factor antagonist
MGTQIDSSGVNRDLKGMNAMGEAHEADVARIAKRGPLTIRSERRDGTHLVEASGEVDLAVKDLLDEEMQRAEATDAPTILLDLKGLEFIDCTGIRLLLRIRARSLSDGDRLRIRRTPRHVHRLIRLAGVEEMLPLVA